MYHRFTEGESRDDGYISIEHFGFPANLVKSHRSASPALASETPLPSLRVPKRRHEAAFSPDERSDAPGVGAFSFQLLPR